MDNTIHVVYVDANEKTVYEEYTEQTYKRIRKDFLDRQKRGEIKVAVVIRGKALCGGLEHEI